MGIGKMLVAMALLLLCVSSFAPETLAYPPGGYLAATSSQTCLEGGRSGPTVSSSFLVAVIKPVFTSTPYSEFRKGSFYGSFYAFFGKYAGARGNVTSNLDWLNTSVKLGMNYNSGWGHSLPLYSFLESSTAKSCGLVIGKNVFLINDINVTNGALFGANGKRSFAAVVIGHEEYVTRAEYDQLREFVASGGILVAMSSNEFYAEVRFDPVTHMETFVSGHGGYAFNGHTAWYSKSLPPPWSTGGWFGSTYCCFHRFHYDGATVNGTDPVGRLLGKYTGDILAPGYTMHEENAVSNLTRTSIVATFYHEAGITVASYTHQYGRGEVVCLCVFGDDLIAHDRSTQFFLVASIASWPGAHASIVQPPSGVTPRLSLFAEIVLGCIALAVPASFLVWRARPRRYPRV